MKARTPPDIEMIRPELGFGSILWHGFDWWSEALNMIMPEALWSKLSDYKDLAKRLDDRCKTPHAIMFGKEEFQIMPTGAAGGKEFIVFNDDLRFEFGSRNREWSVNWRATAAGLAEHGLQKLRDHVYRILRREEFEIREDNYIRVTRCDYAFDIHSDTFTKEMTPKLANTIVTPSEVKVRGDFWSRGHDQGHGEACLKTLTIGSKKGCQVQIYNKVDEITEMSGKTWMYELWEQSGNWYGELEDIWRVEARFAGDWLKKRTSKNPDKVLSEIWVLISDALFNRRITVPSAKDSNRRRWPLHPLFTMIIEEIKNPMEFLPIGIQVTGKKKKLQEILKANIAGTLRSSAVLASSEGEELNEEMLTAIATEAIEHLFSDAEHHKKIRRSNERYALVNEAK